MSSLITFTRYKYGIKRCGFPCDHLVQFTPRVQDYQKVLPKSLHSNMPEGWWKGRNTCRYLLPEDANQVLWILGSLITPFAGSLPSPKVPHSIKIRVKIVCADAHPTLRASPCAWHRSGQGFFPKHLQENKICSTLVQIVQNIGCDKGSTNHLAPNHPCHPGLTLSIWYLYCYREPTIPSPLHSNPPCFPCTGRVPLAKLPLCSQLPFGW